MNNELNELRNQLRMLQEESPSQALSDSCCLEIFSYIVRKRQVKLVYLKSQKEYHTHPALIDFLHSKVIEFGGVFKDIEEEIPLALIEAAALKYSLTMNDRNLYTSEFIQGYTQDMIQWILMKGNVSLKDICEKFKLGYNFTKKVLQF